MTTDRHLVPRQSSTASVCIGCGRMIEPHVLHYVEEGTTTHLHSLIARRFCHACYAMHGERLIA